MPRAGLELCSNARGIEFVAHNGIICPFLDQEFDEKERQSGHPGRYNIGPYMKSAQKNPLIPQQSGAPFGLWVVLFLLANMGLTFWNYRFSSALPPFFSLWLPGGLTAAALLLSARKRWGWFLSLALLTSLSAGWLAGLDPRLNLALSLGSGLGALVFALVAQGKNHQLGMKHTPGSIIGQAAAASAIGALANTGLAFLLLAGSRYAVVMAHAWGVWWMGHFIGKMVMASLCVTWAPAGRFQQFRGQKLIEFLLALLVLGAGANWLGSRDLAQNESLIFITFPVALFLAVRFGLQGASLAGFLLAWLGSWRSHPGMQSLPPAELMLPLRILPHQAYLAIVIFSGLSLAAYNEILQQVALAAEEKKARGKLLEMELFYRSVFEQADEGMAVYDAQTYLPVRFNELACRMHGYTRAEFANLTMNDLNDSEDQPSMSERVEAALTDTNGASLDAIHRTKSGEPRNMHVVVSRISFAGQALLLCAMRDITEIKRSEQARHESDARYHALFDYGGFGVIIVDEHANLLDANAAMARMLGYSREEFLSSFTIRAATYPPDSQSEKDLVREVLAGRQTSFTLEKRFFHRQGHLVWARVSISVIRDEAGQVLYLMGMVEDISDRKRAEAELHFQAHLLDVVSQAIITSDLDGKITYLNRAAEELYGWQAAEALDLPHAELIQTHAHKDAQAAAPSLTSQGRWSGEVEMKRRDGSAFPAQVDEMPIHDGNNQLVGTICVSQDITARKTAEEALRKSNFMRDILSVSLINTPLALIFWKVENGAIEVIDWNPAAEMIFGWVREEVIGTNFLTMLPAQPLERLDPDTLEQLAQGRDIQIIPDECRTRENRPVLVNWFNTLMVDYGNKNKIVYILSLGENITQRKLAEKQIRESLQEKELLLREVYHRVKNNLMVMISLIELQSTNIQDPATTAILKDLQSRIRTMALVHQSLYQSPSLAQVDFEGYLFNLISYITTLYNPPQPVEVTYAIANLPLRIEVAIPCGLIINELVSNAYKYAFPCSAGNGHGARKNNRIHIGFQYTEEEYRIEVRDNGVGLPPDFELNQVHSLGMQLVMILVKQIDGHLEINNNHGASFAITFAKRSDTDGENQNGR